MIDRESTTRTSSVPSKAFAAVRADWSVADSSDDRLMHTTASAPAVGCSPEGVLERAGRRCGCLGKLLGLRQSPVELRHAEIDAIGELLGAEPDRERNDVDVELVGLVLGQVAGAVGDDAHGHG